VLSDFFFLWRRSGDFRNFSALSVGDTVNVDAVGEVVFRGLCLMAVICVFAVEIENLALESVLGLLILFLS